METTYDDLRDIERTLERWRDEDAEPFEARASLLARYHRAQTEEAKHRLLELDSEFFEVWETDGHPTIGVAWRPA